MCGPGMEIELLMEQWEYEEKKKKKKVKKVKKSENKA